VVITDLYPQFPYSRVYNQPSFAFSADSKNIFIGYGGKLHRIDVATGADHIIPFMADIKVDAGPFNYNTYRFGGDSLKLNYTRSANLSPDGKHLVFSALSRLYVMDMPYGRPHPLVDQPFGQFQPVYSPDGKWIAYVSWCDTVGGELWRVPSTGGRPQQLTHSAGQYQRPAWSPDGMSIAIVHSIAVLQEETYSGKGSLDVISVTGGPDTHIGDGVPMWNQLSFSGDGKRIYYEPEEVWKGSNLASKKDTITAQLVSRDVAGKNLETIAIGRTKYLGGYLQQVSFSPDKRYMVYTMNEDLYLVPVSSRVDSIVIYDPVKKIPLIRFASGVDPYWEKTGNMLCWSYGNHFYRINPDKIIAAAQKKKASGTAESDLTTVNVKPDQIIDINLTVPRSYAHGTIALKNARILTMEGNKVIEHGTVLIKDGRFSAVGKNTDVHIPKGTKLMDMSGTTIMPGLIDMHLHMHAPGNIYPQEYWEFLSNFAFGVTTARNPYTEPDHYGYSEELAAGRMIGPRYFVSGQGVSDVSFFPHSRLRNPEDARFIVQKRAELGGSFVKQYMLSTRMEREWLLIASRNVGLNLTNEGEREFMPRIAEIKDGSTGIEHNSEGSDVYNDLTTFIARSGAYLTPTLQARYGSDLTMALADSLYWHLATPKMERFIDSSVLQRILHPGPVVIDFKHNGYIGPAIMDAIILKAGGRVLLGSHGNREAVGVHNELWALQMGGLTNMQVLRAATIMGAEGLGMQQDLGSIKVGKIADLIILNKNPLDDIHNSKEIRYVMKDGILYDGDTLDELWPVYKKGPEWKNKHVSNKTSDLLKIQSIDKNEEN